MGVILPSASWDAPRKAGELQGLGWLHPCCSRQPPTVFLFKLWPGSLLLRLRHPKSWVSKKRGLEHIFLRVFDLVCLSTSISAYYSGWSGTFFIFPYIGNNTPNWLIFFRGVGSTTNQLVSKTVFSHSANPFFFLRGFPLLCAKHRRCSAVHAPWAQVSLRSVATWYHSGRTLAIETLAFLVVHYWIARKLVHQDGS